MKGKFPEYYPVSDQCINDIWNKCVFCYDANVLLNIYRYSKETRDKIFDNINYFSDRTIIPYQAAYEYLKNKREVERSLMESYDKIIDTIKKLVNSLESGDLSSYRKHCALDIDKDIIAPFKRTSERVCSKVAGRKDNHTNFMDADEIHTQITNLFEGKISDEYPAERLNEIYKNGKIRYEKSIPPGFADYNNKKNSPENSLYGDLIIWNHLIDISKNKDVDIIFITDDRKKDWWDIYQGQTKGALPELLREFRKLTNHNILIYTAEGFMKYAPEYTSIDVPKKVVNEIKDLQEIDNNRYFNTIMNAQEKINRQFFPENIWMNNANFQDNELFSTAKQYNSLNELLKKQYNSLNELLKKQYKSIPNFNIQEQMNAYSALNPNELSKSIEKINSIYENYPFLFDKTKKK